MEYTLAQQPTVVNDQEVPAHLEILDLAKDARWKNSPIVCVAPHFRYFCGVPLRTENEINIGALILLDDRPRESTSIARLRGVLVRLQCWPGFAVTSGSSLYASAQHNASYEDSQRSSRETESCPHEHVPCGLHQPSERFPKPTLESSSKIRLYRENSRCE